jgi:hypothetical protein
MVTRKAACGSDKATGAWSQPLMNNFNWRSRWGPYHTGIICIGEAAGPRSAPPSL